MSEPWFKVLPFGPGEPGDEVDRIIYLAAEAIRMCGIMLQIYMPDKANLLLNQLGVADSRRTFEYCGFGRDLEYGTPMVDVGSGHKGILFPPLSSEE